MRQIDLPLKRVDALEPGDLVDLEGDRYADAPDSESDNSEFEFEFQVVIDVVRETPDCMRVDFESGSSFGFPPSHEVLCARVCKCGSAA